MTDEKNTFKHKLMYFIQTLVFALVYLFVTYVIFYSIVNEDLFYATIINTILIIILIIMERIENSTVRKLRSESGTKKLGCLSKILLISNFYTTDRPCGKAALYLFYVIIIILTALHTAKPEVSFLSRFCITYFQSLSTGLLILITFDQFMKQMFDDKL